MRFLIKTAFWLGLAAFFLAPRGEAEGTGVNLVNAVLGAREALSDFTGFCDRAPTACEAGGEIASFAGDRVGDGLSLAYDFAQDKIGGDDPQSEVEVPAAVIAALPHGPATHPAARRTDPVNTAALPAAAAPRPKPAPKTATRPVPADPAHLAAPRPFTMPLAQTAAVVAKPVPGRDIPTGKLPLPPVKKQAAEPNRAAPSRAPVIVPTPAPRT